MLIFISVTTQSHAESSEATPEGCAVWGQVVTPGRSLEEPTLIQLVGVNSTPSQKSRAIDGNFQFHAVPPGWYQFRVLDTIGREIYRLTAALKGSDDHIIVHVP